MKTLSPHAYWIWSEHPFEMHEAYSRFRKKFQLESTSENAQLLISADSRYRLYVNGYYVAFGPARSYPWQQCVEEHDISSLLNEGENTIAVWAYQPGYSHFSYVHRAQAGILAELFINDKSILTSDTTWKASGDQSFSSEVKRISIYGSGQEHRDLQQHEPWTQSSYDNQQWPQARICAGQNQPPWENLQLTPAIQYQEELEQPKFVEAITGDVASDDPHQIILHANKNGQVLDSISPESLPMINEHQVLLLCYEVDYSQVVSAHIEIPNALGGETVLISYLEKGTPGEWVVSDPATYCHVQMTDRYTLAKGANTLEPFTPRGGRFILVGIVGAVKHALELNVRYRPRRRNLSLKTPIDTSNKKLNAIAEMCWRSMSACLQDTLMDCPWREQAHWSGDGVIAGRMITELCGDIQPLRRMLELVSQHPADDGVLPSVTPSETHAYVALAYNFSWVEALNTYVSISGDTDFLETCWPILQNMLERFDKDLAHDGLIRSQLGRRYFLDWAEISDEEPNAFYNFRYLLALQLATSLAKRLNKKTDSQLWSQRTENLSTALHNCFYRDGVWYDQQDTHDRSQHVATFLILTGLLQGDVANKLMDQAVDSSLEKSSATLILSSPYMHYYLFEALSQLNRKQDIHDIIEFRWGCWLDQGAVTTWENWEIDFPDGSACHGWSAHPLLYL
jgi:alpha-L-rhamnosidase